MLKNITDFFKKNSMVSVAVFIVLTLLMVMNYSCSTNYIVSLVVSLIIWTVVSVLAVINKYPNKIFTEKFSLFRLVLALGFSICSVVFYTMTNRDPIEYFSVYNLLLCFVITLWFYYTVIPDITVNFKKRLVFSFLISSALTFTCLIYLPFESYISNIDSFEFDCFNFLDYYLFVFFTATVLLALLLNSFKAKFYWVIYKGLVGLSLAIFVQYMFLNSHLSLLGVANDNSAGTAVTIINLVIWIAIFVAVYVLPKFIKNAWINTYKILSGLVLGYHIIAFVIMLVLAPSSVFSTTVEFYTDTSEQFTLSNNNNVVVIVFDAFDNSIVKDLAENNPEYFDGLEDFTVYTNTTSVYDSTVTSMSQIFGGCDFDNTLTIEEWLDKGWNSDSTVTFYNEMHNSNYKCNAYNFELPLKEYVVGKYDNIKQYETEQEIKPNYFNINKFVDEINLLSFYKVAPYALKNCVSFDADAFKYYCIYPMSDVASYSNSEYISNMSYSYVDENIMTVNHLRGLHSPCIVPDEIDNCFVIMNKLVDEMKSSGVYDNSTIIFMSDHGWHNEDATTDGWGATPMFFIKAPGVSQDDTIFTSTPISTTDVLGTIIVDTGLDGVCKYDTSIYDFDENSSRVRYFYDRVRDPELPDVYSTGKLWYIVKYNAFAKYEITDDSAIMYGVDPFTNGNEILPMKEYFG